MRSHSLSFDDYLAFGQLPLQLCHYLSEPIRFFVHYEQIEEDFAELCGLLKIAPRRLPKLAAGGTPLDWKSFYTPDSAALVRERYAEDFGRFYPEEQFP